MNKLSYTDYERVVKEIYQTRWFTNHGPKARAFEREVVRYCKVDYAIAVSTDILATIITLTGVVDRSIYLHDDSSIDIINAVEIAMVDYRPLSVNIDDNRIVTISGISRTKMPFFLYESKENFITAVKFNNNDIKNVPVIIYSNAICQFQAQGDALLQENWIRIHPLDSWFDEKKK